MWINESYTDAAFFSQGIGEHHKFYSGFNILKRGEKRSPQHAFISIALDSLAKPFPSKGLRSINSIFAHIHNFFSGQSLPLRLPSLIIW